MRDIYLEDIPMQEFITIPQALRIIDDVMNNREINTIRNAILAIRDNVLKAAHNKFYNSTFLVPIRKHCAILPDYDEFGISQDDAKYAVLDMDAKIDTGLYGAVKYFKGEEKIKCHL